MNQLTVAADVRRLILTKCQLLTLTPAHSPGKRENYAQRPEKSSGRTRRTAFRHPATGRRPFPLHRGKGQGEGGRHH
jgi:hypothetical protein